MATISDFKHITKPVYTGFWLEQLQGKPVVTQFLPDSPVDGLVFIWHRFGNPGGMTPQVGSTSQTPDATTDYQQLTGETIEYREGAFLGEKAIKFTQNVRKIQNDHMTTLSERMVLRQEFLIANELINSAAISLDLAAIGEDRQWGSENADPLADLKQVKKKMRLVGHRTPTDIIMNAESSDALSNNVAFRTHSISGEFGVEMIKEGTLGKPSKAGAEGRILGMDIWVSDAFYYDQYHATPEIDQTATYLLDNTIILVHNHAQLGYTAVSEPFTVRTYENYDRRAIVLQCWKTMAPIVSRPEWVATITNVIQ